jgi:hypothetical protein
MKPIAQSPWKQRGLFFLVGALFAIVCGVIQYHWMDIVPYTAFDQQPDWLKGLKRVVGWLPWIAVAAVVVLRLVKGRGIRVVFYLLGTATPHVVLVGWLICGDSVENLWHSRRFDAELWRSQPRIECNNLWPPRLCMVDDLIASGRLKGLTSNQVVELLGPSHDKSFPFGAVGCDVHYYLGPERGLFRIDSEWLFVKFGKDGKVERYWLYRD